MTLEQWQKLEEAALAEAQRDESPIGRHEKLARYLVDQILRTPISFMGAYEAARQFAAPEILPHIISRLDRIDRELENPWL